MLEVKNVINEVFDIQLIFNIYYFKNIKENYLVVEVKIFKIYLKKGLNGVCVLGNIFRELLVYTVLILLIVFFF